MMIFDSVVDAIILEMGIGKLKFLYSLIIVYDAS